MLRSVGLKLLCKVLKQKGFASQLLDEIFQKQSWDPRDKALLTEIIYGTLRNKIYLDSILETCLDLKKTPSWLLSLLNLALYQLYFLDRVPDHAVIHESVEIAKKKGGLGLGKLTNGVLRRLQRQRETYQKDRLALLQLKVAPKNEQTLKKLAQVYSLPFWLWNRWQKRLSWAELKKRSQYFLEKPPLYLRANRTKISLEGFQKKLESLGIDFEAMKGSPVYYLPKSIPAEGDLLIKEGWASIQDLSSYQVIGDLKLFESAKVLDACAGHGGKAAAIAEKKNKVKLYIHDITNQKIKVLYNNFKRLNLQAPELCKAAGSDCRDFDILLIDAPCSGTGTLSRHPEIRLRLNESDLKRLAAEQLKILKTWAKCLKPGGQLIYAVCSFEEEEGSQVVERFLQSENHFELIDKNVLGPNSRKQDGFFVARLRRKN